MKKVKFLFVALMAVMLVTFTACEKEDVLQSVKYAAVVDGGDVMFADNDITLKSAPTTGGHNFECYRKYVTSSWEFVDGSEFLPGSAAALDWSTGNGLNRSPWYANGTGVYVTYCPVLPMRFVSKATSGANGTAISYLGIYDFTPNANSFPITLNGRRLGDVLQINTDALTALPGYSNMSFDVTYTKNLIDVDGTIKNSTADTKTGWPNYSYTGDPIVDTAHLSGAGLGVQTIYDGLEYTITDTITVAINVDGTTIKKKTAAPGSDKGLKITLTTNKVGWYNSGIINLTDVDITVEEIEMPVN